MSPEHQPQPPEKRDEDRLRQLEEDIRVLHRQISKIEARVRKALEQLKTADLLTP